MSTNTAATETPEGIRLGAIDIGSNSIRLVIAQLDPGGEYRILDEEREPTRLASALGTTGQLTPESIEATLAALRRFRKLIDSHHVTHLRTIATCAVREAENADELLRRAQEETGLEIEVISARQEAQFAFLSVQHAFDISDRNVAVADIGGGSTEIVLASGNFIEEMYTTPLGAVRVTELFGGSDKMESDAYTHFESEIDRELKRYIKKPPFMPQILYGSGGTFTSLASMMIATKKQGGAVEWGYRVTRADVRHMVDRISKMNLKQRRAIEGLNADRADIIVAGLAIIDRIMCRLKVNVLIVHNRGVRDGLLLSMIEQLRPAEQRAQNRARAIEQFATNCGVDMAHAQQVTRLAKQLFQQLLEPMRLDPRDEPLLEAAAMLQDVGYLINYEQHHKHSYHLILNSQLAGLRRRDLELVANVARYHRGAKPKKKHDNFRRLAEDDRDRVRKLAAIVRIASALDRSHRQHVEQVTLRVIEDKTYLSVDAREDPEVDLWAVSARAGLFQDVFHTEVIVDAPETSAEFPRVIGA